MAVQLWKDGKDGPEMVLIEPEVFNLSFLDHGYRFTKEKPEHDPEPDHKLEPEEESAAIEAEDAEPMPDAMTEVPFEPRRKYKRR